MNSSNRTGRPRGSRQAKPSKKAIANYYRLLSDRADSGDVLAAGKLIELDLLDRQKQEPCV